MGRMILPWRLYAAALTAGPLLLGHMSHAETRALPEAEVFTDWRVLCQQGESGRTCQMLQSASAGNAAASVFLLSISPGQVAGTSYAVVTVPVGVYLAPGIEIRVDHRRPFKALYEICDRTGCHAGFKLSGKVLDAFRQGLDAKVRVWTGQSQAVEFPVSLRGFSAAYRYYQDQGAL
ncbi:invasion associated locus B family protein [Roseovarius sp.]|uniref:invasion associated locus B family protein n=1 Tax=Roseovarius sp. TaxID=1486281 RepID=UPI00257E3738|nr:invasion associated locus B family protein [Roseovarius sp.]